MTKQDDVRYMAVALSLGRRGMGRVWPNPAVGCVIVKDNQIIGRGWTADGGRPHAESQALGQAGAQAEGATAYVTLEPCAHQGKTPPCANALVDAGIARVVIATGDPDPRVAGKGVAILQAAGIAVEQDVCAAEAKRDHAGFLKRITQQRPFVTLKLAGTMDGRIATASGESQWITGPQARRTVHMMRARHDAVLVGAGTVTADDPSLTVRDLGIARQPVRIIVSHAMKIGADAKLAQTARDVPVWLCHGPEAVVTDWVALGADSILCPVIDAQVDVTAMMTAIADKGITRVFCEGGGQLGASLLRAGVVDRLVTFTAGAAIGSDGRPMLGKMGVDHLAGAPRFKLEAMQQLGDDVCHIWSKP